MFNSKPNLQKTLTDAQLRVSAAETKGFLTALERCQVAVAEAAKAKGVLALAEDELVRVTSDIDQTKERAGFELANGQMSEADAARAIRAARDAEDLCDAKLAGLRRRTEALNTEMTASAEAFRESTSQFESVLKAAIRQRLAVVAIPFAVALRQCIAIDAELKLGMSGLAANKIHDPEFPQLAGEFEQCDTTFWYEDSDALAVTASLAPFTQMIVESDRVLMAQLETQRENETGRQAKRQSELLVARSRGYGTSTDQRGLSSPLIAA